MSRHRRDDDGAAAVMLALCLLAVFAIAALVIDMGAILLERRVLQNGADAAALAIAQDCAGDACPVDPWAVAATMADANADDAASTIEDVCGSVPPLLPCTDPPTLADGAQYVQVITRTHNPADGSDLVHYGPASIFGVDGGTARARTIVAWGGLAGAATLPLIFSLCEYIEFVGPVEIDPDGMLVPLAGIDPDNPVQATIYFHGSEQAGSCPAGPSGFDLPGGFGWLETDGDCEADITLGGWVDDKTGVAVVSGCDPSEWRNQTVLIPIYDHTNDLTGTNGEYHVAGFAAFYITGYRFPGAKWPSTMSCPEQPGGSGTCLQGYFTNYVPTDGELGGPDLGVVVVKVIG